MTTDSTHYVGDGCTPPHHVPGWTAGGEVLRSGVERRAVADLRPGDVLVVGGEVYSNDPRRDGTYLIHSETMGRQTIEGNAAVLVVVDRAKLDNLLPD